MRNIISHIFNIPWTITGLVIALVSFPHKVQFQSNAIVFNIKKFWWTLGYMKGARAVNIGHVILLGPKLDPKDLAHELVHVEQYTRYPFIYPFLYYYELLRKGYRNNRFEHEAYQRAGNHYGKLS